MAYLNTKAIDVEELAGLVGQEVGESIAELANTTEEACIFVQKKEAFDHYTIRLKGLKNFSLKQTDSLLQAIDIEIKELTPTYALLEKDQYRKGILHFYPDYYELKIFSQSKPIDKKLRQEYEALWKQLDSPDFEHNMVANKLDSIAQLDSINAVNQFAFLIEQEKKSTGKSDGQWVNYNSIFKEGIENSAALLYLDSEAIAELPFHMLNLLNDSFYEYFESPELGSSILNYHENIWLKLSHKNNSLNISSVLSNKAKKPAIHQKLDRDLIKYLPAGSQSIFCYHLKAANLKYHLATHLQINSMREDEAALSKLAILAMDDDWVNALGNGFITIADSNVGTKETPDFKLAIKMPNYEKGQLLLSILENDFNAIQKAGNDHYIVKHKKLDFDEPLNLIIKKDIWILGTAPFETLGQTIDRRQIKKYFPKVLHNKMTQHIILNRTLAKLFKMDFETVELNSYLLNKRKVRTDVFITMN
ncbi:hypothetical protein [Carboxylicivirga taeanensis]|uniref:hypothetical protein n=1 Tax=Carboxylicivirga taeanensis TaxID=1416875 RepID=UPI003F6DE8FA